MPTGATSEIRDDLTCALLILDRYNCISFSMRLVVSEAETDQAGGDSERPPGQMTGL